MSNLKPDAFYESVSDIEFEYLTLNNIKGVLLDIDNTLIDMTKTMPDSVYKWVLEAKEKGFRVAILSNTNKLEKLDPLSEKLGIPYISFAKKPAKSRIH